jgi:hypothetical protein
MVLLLGNLERLRFYERLLKGGRRFYDPFEGVCRDRRLLILNGSNFERLLYVNHRGFELKGYGGVLSYQYA